MAQVDWTSSSSGNWSTGSNWTGGSAPAAGDTVLIDVPSVTVTFSTGTDSVATLNTTQSTLDVTGGALTISTGATITGAYEQSGGSFIIQSGNTEFSGGLSLTGGLLENLSADFSSSSTYAQSAGTLVLAGTGGTFNNNLVQTGGLISLRSGTLGLAGAVTTLDGTVAGNGTLLVEGAEDGLNGTTTIEQTTVLSIGKISITSGVFALAGSTKAYTYTYGGYLSASFGTVALGGNTLNLTGHADLDDQISGAGTVITKGAAQLDNLSLVNAAVLTIESTATVVPYQDNPGQVTLQNNADITIAKGASLILTGNDFVNDTNFNSKLLDDGTLSRVAGVGQAEIFPSFTEAGTATVAIAAGVLDFSGVSNSFSGTVSGAGTLSLGAFYTGQPQDFSFNSGIALTVASITLAGQTTNDALTVSSSITYGGNWSQIGGLFQMLGTSPVLDLTGSVILDGGVIKTNTGTINTTGLVSLGNSQNYQLGVDIEGFTEFVVNDVVRQAASIQFGAQSGSKPTAIIASTGSWLLEDGAGITGPYGTVINDGTLAKLVGSGVSNIDGTLNNYGVFNIAASEVLLDGSGTLAGTISGAGQLDLEGNGIYTLSGAITLSSTQTASALALDVSHVLIGNTPFGSNASVVSLGENLTYAGVWAQDGGTVQLNDETLTLTGTSALDGGTLTGPGTLTAAGPLTIGNSASSTYTVGSQAELNVTKSAEQSVNLTVSALGDLNVAAGATYTIDDAATIAGNGSLTIAGTLYSTAGGTTTIDPSVIVTGRINANEGVLNFLSSVTGSGTVLAHAGTSLGMDGAVSNSTTVDLAAGNCGLFIGDAPAFQGLIDDFTKGDSIEFQQLASGVIYDSLVNNTSNNTSTLTISDSDSHTFTLDFNSLQSLSGTSAIVISDGANGYIGIYHM